MWKNYIYLMCKLFGNLYMLLTWGPHTVYHGNPVYTVLPWEPSQYSMTFIPLSVSLWNDGNGDRMHVTLNGEPLEEVDCFN